jgi:hypothetical protein
MGNSSRAKRASVDSTVSSSQSASYLRSSPYPIDQTRNSKLRLCSVVRPRVFDRLYTPRATVSDGALANCSRIESDRTSVANA